jgi:beta-glucosidase
VPNKVHDPAASAVASRLEPGREILTFPQGFLWGAATAAFQIEGSLTADGRGESIWDAFCRLPGRTADGSDAAVACDHYDRWRDDVALVRELGLNAYRFSVGWPRVLPDGRGPTNEAGLDFYDRLLDALLAAGITPMVTLNHWDLPLALQAEGGWASRDTCAAFVSYADVVSRRLGDRVRQWVTHNEPWCIASLGHEFGSHAPGLREPHRALTVAHHLLLSHGWAVPVLRRNAPGSEVGIVDILTSVEPASDSDADRDAARWYDGFFNRWYLEPLFRGEYPADAIADRVRRGHLAGPELPFVRPGDLGEIAAPIDFLGVNYYSRSILTGSAGPRGEPGPRVVPPHERPVTDMGWEVWPQGLEDVLRRVHRDYRPPRIYVTENGAAYTDVVESDGRIRDVRRQDYLRGHLRAAHRAIADGVPLAGYFHWSLLDNFEWGQGFSKRFGLVHLDRATQRRIPRDSATVYRDVARANALTIAASGP